MYVGYISILILKPCIIHVHTHPSCQSQLQCMSYFDQDITTFYDILFPYTQLQPHIKHPHEISRSIFKFGRVPNYQPDKTNNSIHTPVHYIDKAQVVLNNRET